MPPLLPTCWSRAARIGLLLVLAVLGAACTATRPAQQSGASGSSPGDPLRWSDGERIQQLYHVQVTTADRRATARRAASDVQTWWRRLPVSQRPDALAGRDELPVAVAWQTPYYRVRIGPFVRREQARRLLDAAATPFPNAIIALEPVPAR